MGSWLPGLAAAAAAATELARNTEPEALAHSLSQSAPLSIPHLAVLPHSGRGQDTKGNLRTTGHVSHSWPPTSMGAKGGGQGQGQE